MHSQGQLRKFKVGERDGISLLAGEIMHYTYWYKPVLASKDSSMCTCMHAKLIKEELINFNLACMHVHIKLCHQDH